MNGERDYFNYLYSASVGDNRPDWPFIPAGTVWHLYGDLVPWRGSDPTVLRSIPFLSDVVPVRWRGIRSGMPGDRSVTVPLSNSAQRAASRTACIVSARPPQRKGEKSVKGRFNPLFSNGCRSRSLLSIERSPG